MSGFSMFMPKVSKMKSLDRFLAVVSILGLAKSIIWSEFSKRWVNNVRVFTFLGAGIVFVELRYLITG